MNKDKFSHIPVLLNETIKPFDYLDKAKGVFVDGTLGLGGHTIAFAKAYPKIEIIGIDKDSGALKEAYQNIEDAGIKKRVTFVHDDFSDISHILKNKDIDEACGALLDLGVSSMQLDDMERGFSFQDPEQKLDMRMNQDAGKTASDILNNYSKEELEQVFARGEARNFRDIARYTTNKREERYFKTVGDFLEVLKEAIPTKMQKTSKTHFATDAFRALRLEVNNELVGLDTDLEKFIDSLKSGGRLAVISFHSLEDRIVKHTFKKLESPCTCPPKFPACVCGLQPKIKILNKKPIVASENEVLKNPRARSAKLRIVEKL